VRSVRDDGSGLIASRCVEIRSVDRRRNRQPPLAERLDKPVADLFDMQDEIVSRLANTLDAQLITAEARRAESSLHPDALDLVF
jgi:TolB-like protein